MTPRQSIVATLSIVALVGALAGCSNTWEGLKKDTGNNMEATGKALEKGGESVKK